MSDGGGITIGGDDVPAWGHQIGIDALGNGELLLHDEGVGARVAHKRRLFLGFTSVQGVDQHCGQCAVCTAARGDEALA